MLWSLQCVEWERNKTLSELGMMLWAQGNPPAPADAELLAAVLGSRPPAQWPSTPRSPGHQADWVST